MSGPAAARGAVVRLRAPTCTVTDHCPGWSASRRAGTRTTPCDAAGLASRASPDIVSPSGARAALHRRARPQVCGKDCERLEKPAVTHVARHAQMQQQLAPLPRVPSRSQMACGSSPRLRGRSIDAAGSPPPTGGGRLLTAGHGHRGTTSGSACCTSRRRPRCQSRPSRFVRTRSARQVERHGADATGKHACQPTSAPPPAPQQRPPALCRAAPLGQAPVKRPSRQPACLHSSATLAPKPSKPSKPPPARSSSAWPGLRPPPRRRPGARHLPALVSICGKRRRPGRGLR